MSLYKECQTTCSVYHADDSDTTKTSSYPASADFTIKMTIFRRGEDFIALGGAETGEFVANVDANLTNASSILQGDKVVDGDSQVYFVVNDPKYLRLVKKYKILLSSEDLAGHGL
jgi:hypothetical protein